MVLKTRLLTLLFLNIPRRVKEVKEIFLKIPIFFMASLTLIRDFVEC